MTECGKFSALKEIPETKKERRGLGAGGRGVLDGIKLAAPQIKGLGLGAVERAGAPAAEDGELVAGLVDGTSSIDALRNC